MTDRLLKNLRCGTAILALSALAGISGASAQTCSANPPSCEELGYTMTTKMCGQAGVKCPFDTSKVNCEGSVSGVYNGYVYKAGEIKGVAIPGTEITEGSIIRVMAILPLTSEPFQTYSQASSFCAAQKGSLPSRDELKKIYANDTGIYRSLTNWTGQGTAGANYWTKETSGNKAYVIHLEYGTENLYSQSSTAYSLCVTQISVVTH